MRKYAKSLAAAVAAGAGSLAVALDDGAVMPGEWITAALAVAGALGIVYAVPNRNVGPSR